MRNAEATFKKGIGDARQLTTLYNYLAFQVLGPMSFDDVLRFSLVYAVSSLDKLIHDLIRVGMVATFAGQRASTPTFQAYEISLEIHQSLAAATFPTPEIVFEQHVARSLSHQSFQTPSKIATGLALIWPEKNKWAKIASAMDTKERNVTNRLKLIASQRHAIVHEADLNPVTGEKNPITQSECDDSINFIEKCGCTIVSLVLL